MKRKCMMLGFAMMTGLPQPVCAKGFGKEENFWHYVAWNTPYSPHYGKESEAYPLMDHFSAAATNNVENSWKMQLSPPEPDRAGMDTPLQGRDKRLGISFKLEF